MLLNRKVFGRDPKFPSTALLETPAGWEWWCKQMTPAPLLPRPGRGQPCSSFLCCTTELSGVTQDHGLWFSIIKLRLVGSKSWNGGRDRLPLEWTRQRKGLTNSLPNVAAPSRAGDQQLIANWCSSCFPSAQRVPARMFVLCSSSYNAPKQITNKCRVVRLSSTPEALLAVQLFRQGVAATSSQQRLLRKLLGDVSAALTFIPLRDSDCTLSWTAVYSLTLGGCLLATRLMLKIKQPMQNKQKSLLAKSIVGVCCFKKLWVVCICFLVFLPWGKEWREV